jgi:hypothetical protein
MHVAVTDIANKTTEASVIFKLNVERLKGLDFEPFRILYRCRPFDIE